MALLDAFVLEPFSVNEQLIDSLLLEPDQFEFWISATATTPTALGTACDPYDGSSQALFDKLMASFPPYTTVHLGPGPFQTNGSNGGWKPKSGWRIVGSGFEETFLKLVNATSTTALTAAIGSDSTNFLNGFEASDLTVDCNLAAQGSTACGAISVSGSHIYIHRVRVINFGTQAVAVKGGAILIGNSDPSTPEVFDCVVEDCIIEQPSPNNVRETTCIGIGAKEDANGFMAYHRACVIRNCFIDCLYADNPIAVSVISYSGTIATFNTTPFPHGLTGAWVVVTGALENSVPSAFYNGSFTVSNPTTYTFQFTMPIPGPSALPTGQIYIRRPPSQRVAIQSISRSFGGSNWTVTLTTLTPHNRVLGGTPNNVAVNGATPSGYNGVFAITAIPSPTQLQYTLTSDPGAPDATNAYIGVDFRAIEADGGIGTIIENTRIYNCTFGLYHDTYSSKDMVIRNNHFRGVNTAIYHKMGGLSPNGSQTPTRTGSSLTRNSALAIFTTSQPHGFGVGAVISVSGSNLSQYNGTFQIASVPTPTSFTYALSADPGADSGGTPVCNGAIAAVSLVRNKTLATFTSNAPHGFSFGQAVAVAGATPATYNGTFAVASVPTPASFTYLLPSDPGTNATGSLVFGALWQAGRLVVENNVIELILNVIPSGWEAPVAVCLYDTVGAHGSQYVFQQVIIRGNVIRQVDNASDASATPLAIFLDSCLNAIVENNDINLDTATPVRHYTVGTAKYFNNQNPAGKLIQGASCAKFYSDYSKLIYKSDTFNQYVNELTTDADFALLLALKNGAR